MTTNLTDGTPVPDDGSHQEVNLATGMQRGYVVLSEEERKKGFVRPLRATYRHVGVRPVYETRELTPAEHERYDQYGYVAYEGYPEVRQDHSSVTGRFWTQAQLESGCGGETTMGLALAETYARQPDFYGGTFCAVCKAHFPVGEHGEFVWLDGERVGS